MRNKIIEQILKDKEVSTEYENSLKHNLNQFLNYTQLPLVYEMESLDKNKFSVKAKKLYENIQALIDERHNLIINLSSYKDSGFLTSILLGRYFIDTTEQDTHLSSVLYIDTNLLMEDYKHLMDKNTDSMSPSLVHNLDVLYKGVETAEFIFWDKFTMIQSNYEISKLYDILSIRYRRCFGNIFFITGGKEKFQEQISIEMLNVMGTPIIIDLSGEEFVHIK